MSGVKIYEDDEEEKCTNIIMKYDICLWVKILTPFSHNFSPRHPIV